MTSLPFSKQSDCAHLPEAQHRSHIPASSTNMNVRFLLSCCVKDMSERSSILPRKAMRNGARSLGWRERNWLMHAGASGEVYAELVVYGEVGAGSLHRVVPERNALDAVEWRALVRERHTPFHSVRESSATLKLVS